MSGRIFLSNDERDKQVLGEDALRAAVECLRENGYVVVENVIRPELLGRLREKLDQDAASFAHGRRPWRGGGTIIGHLGIHPLPYSEFLHREVLANPVLMSVTSLVLGKAVFIEGVGGNTNFPNSVPQEFHSDVDDWSGKRLLINIPLSDVDERNGSLEVIPGTHRPECKDRRIQDLLRESPSLRVNTRLGSAVIRFPNMIHRGTRNSTKNPRHMVVMWHSSSPKRTGNAAKDTLDPRSESFLSDYEALAHEDEGKRLHPIFYPNIFPTGVQGMVREFAYRYFPGPYSLTRKLIRRGKGALSLGG